MDPITHEQLQADKDAELISKLRVWAFTPPERERLEAIAKSLRSKSMLTPREAWILTEIDEFWKRQERQTQACIGPQPR